MKCPGFDTEDNKELEFHVRYGYIFDDHIDGMNDDDTDWQDEDEDDKDPFSFVDDEDDDGGGEDVDDGGGEDVDDDDGGDGDVDYDDEDEGEGEADGEGDGDVDYDDEDEDENDEDSFSFVDDEDEDDGDVDYDDEDESDSKGDGDVDSDDEDENVEDLPPPPDDLDDDEPEEVESEDEGTEYDEDEGEPGDEGTEYDEDEPGDDGIEYDEKEDEPGDEGMEYDEEEDEPGDEGIEYDEEEDSGGEEDEEDIVEDGKIYLGRTAQRSVQLPLATLKRHFVALGASGSGKTVFGKCILEEATRNGIPSIIIDPQGDLASLILGSSEEECEEHNIPLRILTEFREKAEVRIFTPASSRGIPLCINPLKTLPEDFSPEDVIRALDTVSNSMAGLLGYKADSDSARAASSYIYHILEVAWRTGESIEDFNKLGAIVSNPDMLGIDDSSAIIKKKEREKLAQKIRHLTMGIEKLLFSFGFPLDLDEMFTPVEEGKVPVNVIYLNTLSSEEHKQFFVAVVGNELYNWMLSHPSKEVQALFYIDEVAPYLPPHPFNPPAKGVLKLLFKQGRKYGVSCMMCTQNPADVDYKAMAQANTWALGRMMMPQDLKKVAGMLKSISSGEAEGILERLPILRAGEFILICPDIYDKAQQMKVRWLVTQHETLEAEGLKEVIPQNILDNFDKRSKGMAAIARRKERPPREEPPAEKKAEEKPPVERKAEEKPPVKECSNCGKPLKPGATFCPKCGTSQKVEKKSPACPKCGKKLRSTAVFCTGCGTKLVEEKKVPKKKGLSKKPEKPQKKFCPKCGNTLKADATFCTKCGNKLKRK